MGNTQFKIPTLWLLLSFTFGGTTSSCFSFKLLALPSLKELAITPADIYYCLSRILIIKHWSRELRCQNCTDCVWSLLSADPPSSIRIRGMASLDFWLWVTSLQDWLQTLLFPADEYTYHENHDISKADALLFSCDPLPWLEGFKRLNQSHCTG